MNKKNLYIGITLFLVLVIILLLGWSIFVGRQQQALTEGTQDLGYFDSSRDTSSDRGGFFGGVFGNSNTTNEPGNQAEQENLLSEPLLRQLYNLPTAGFLKKRSNAIRFTDKATGHVFEKDLPDGVTTRIDQTTIPRVQHALFVTDGDGVIRQYIDDDGSIISVYSNLKKDDSENHTLSAHILEIVVSPSGEEIAFVQRTQEGSGLFISQPTSDSQTLLNSSPLRGWNIDWENEVILLSQKASGSLSGSAYILNVDSKQKTLVLQQLKGLVTDLSPDGTTILYSYINAEGIPVLNTKQVSVSEPQNELGIAGLAEKCVWHPYELKIFCALPDELPDELPDSWYQGTVQFSDSVFEIDVSTNKVSRVVSPETEHGVSLDMTNMAMNDSGTVIFFTNKTDQTLWSLTLPQLAIEETLPSEESEGI